MTTFFENIDEIIEIELIMILSQMQIVQKI